MADSTNLRDLPIKADPAMSWPVYAIEWDKWTPQVESTIVLDLMGLQQDHRHSGFRIYTQSKADLAQFNRVMRMLGVSRCDTLPRVDGQARCAAVKMYYVDEKPILDYQSMKVYVRFLGVKQSHTRMTKGGDTYPVFQDRTRPLPAYLNPAYKPMPARTDGQYILPPWAQLY